MKLTTDEMNGCIVVFVILFLASCGMYLMFQHGFEGRIPELKTLVIVLYLAVLIMSASTFYFAVKTKLMSKEDFEIWSKQHNMKQ